MKVSDGLCSILLEGRSAENSPVLRNVRCGFAQKKEKVFCFITMTCNKTTADMKLNNSGKVNNLAHKNC